MVFPIIIPSLNIADLGKFLIDFLRHKAGYRRIIYNEVGDCFSRRINDLTFKLTTLIMLDHANEQISYKNGNSFITT